MSDPDPRELARRTEPPAPPPEGGLPMYVSDLASIEHQVGSNIIQALQHEGAMGVLTIVRAGPGGQRIVSVPLNEEHLARVNDALVGPDDEESTASIVNDDGVPCVGLHCYLPHRKAAKAEESKE